MTVVEELATEEGAVEVEADGAVVAVAVGAGGLVGVCVAPALEHPATSTAAKSGAAASFLNEIIVTPVLRGRRRHCAEQWEFVSPELAVLPIAVRSGSGAH